MPRLPVRLALLAAAGLALASGEAAARGGVFLGFGAGPGYYGVPYGGGYSPYAFPHAAPHAYAPAPYGAVPPAPSWPYGAPFAQAPGSGYLPTDPGGGPYVPPAAPPGPSGPVCRAGAVTCPLPGPVPSGEPCACPTGRGDAWGRVGG